MSFRKLRRRRGQAQTEYIIVVMMTFFAAILAVNGVSGTVGTDTGSDVDIEDVQVGHTRVITFPGLKDAMYVYQDKLYRVAANYKPRKYIWSGWF